MCKTGRKINKINFNKFIWLYWKYIYIYIYIYIIFFWGFSSSWNNEKKKGMKKKIKKKCCIQLTGLLPIFSYAGSRYSKLYHDTGRAVGAQGQAGLGHDMVERARSGTPRYGQPGTTTLPVGLRYGWQRARAALLLECVTIQSLYHDRSEGWTGWGWVTVQSIVS